ncbi:hydroxymethylpyrimidine kinase /phosphomethylpyrimidine kinase [Haloactinospora alba]|uniref:Hydroxymethylpyrimidine kinase /phosphomethylpyrimidine kinase n=1 Tax=Haloactinospora alba TaxID=405555 RepID=A0A543NGI1_9ACTN|nr:bifunctional hydroxymethylpyrimidine kinase/phosphomethylpyrimidine kinase [Haloactinospora alba]TQN30958.1 hydroxymethylpyrimidine kinase /phosphomethylpyrimidine kinase [Haloactinospora alba]
MRSYNILSVAGSDPSGGAGVQADLKTFSALGGYGMSVLTALTAQSTTGVTGVHEVPARFVGEQLDTLLSDVRVDAVKIGMLASAEIVGVVASAIDRYGLGNVVLDPVMVAKSGDRLLADSATEALRTELLPRADLLTPNLPEAADLLGSGEARDIDGMAEQAERLRAMGASRVLLKGGHLASGDGVADSGQAEARSVDVLVTAASEPEVFSARRVATRNTHGTGCTLSSAVAALRPQRGDFPTAVSEAKTYLTAALEQADTLEVGNGRGPLHHFFSWWGEPSRDGGHRS